MTRVSLSDLPKGSKLILVGDWYRKPGSGWNATCYFLSEENEPFRKGMPVDLLPALTPGTIFPRTSVKNEAKGYTGTFKVPAIGEWEERKYADLPESLKRLREFSDQIACQVVYRIEAGKRVIWLPASELARMLFFHSSEVVRAAVYEGNTWQLARKDQQDWVGEIAFMSNVPVSYLNSLQFRKFFAWLLFIDDAEESFCSIFDRLNEKQSIQNFHERWTFDFRLPNLGGSEISWAGYTGSEKSGEKHHCYIREIRSIAGLTSPPLETIYFSHPDDSLILEKDVDDSEKNDDKSKKQQTKINPKEIDPYNPPKAGRKRHLLHLNSSGLHFDTEIDLRRSPRQVTALAKGDTPTLDELQDEDTVGITEGSDQGNTPRADIDNLDKQDLIDAPEKMKFFENLLEKLKDGYGWEIESQTGSVPQKNCRSAHLIKGRPRCYCHAALIRDEDSTVHILEIELKKSEKLSTLIYRTNSSKKTLDNILGAL